MKTNELIESFKTWDGNAWMRYHLAMLQGNHQVKGNIPDGEAPKVKRIRQVPYVNHDPLRRDRKILIRTVGIRQAKKLIRKYGKAEA